MAKTSQEKLMTMGNMPFFRLYKKLKTGGELYMTIWEGISPHIHKVVSCVLTIPFVELSRPTPPRRCRTSPNTLSERLLLTLIYLFFTPLKINSTKRGQGDAGRDRALAQERYRSLRKSNIYILLSEAEEQKHMSVNSGRVRKLLISVLEEQYQV